MLVGGRGKAGGVKVAKNADEAGEFAGQILRCILKACLCVKYWWMKAAAIEHEIYFSITNDRAAKKPVMIASAAGGIDIEEVAANTPEKIVKVHIDPLLGLRDYQARDIAASIDLPRELGATSVRSLPDYGALILKPTPHWRRSIHLSITKDKRLIALDGKMMIDDNALFRHSDLAEIRDIDEEAPAETEARRHGLSFIKLDGDIGCMVNGAGLAMTSMDIVKLFGGEPANFLDIGGGAGAEKVAAAMRIILSDPNVKAVLFNIFGGITRGDEVARGILTAMEDVKPKVPMVIRLVGTNAEEAVSCLRTPT